MTAIQTLTGYEQTKLKLNKLEQRLAKLNQRSDLSAIHWREVQRSYQKMIAQYRSELKLYEAAHPEVHTEQ